MKQQLKPVILKDMTLTAIEIDDADIDIAYAEVIFDDEEKCVAHKHLAIATATGIKIIDDENLDTNGYYACGILTEGKKYKGVFYNDNLIDVLNIF